ncbi:hypothetical protein BH11ACT4_BH11ACT4_04450 [soil metagenome]
MLLLPSRAIGRRWPTPGRPGRAGPAEPQTRRVETLGGYRMVRKLGEGARAEVFLGHPTRAGAEGRAVAIKVFRAGIADASITAEIESLSRAAGEHALALQDVTTAPDGAQALILQRLQGRSLARLLGDRPQRGVGEAITILAPLALALRRMHAAGVVHGAIRQDAVLFDAAGAPVLACFGRAFPITPGQPPALLDAVPGVALDIRAFAGVTAAVLSAVDHPSARALGDWAESAPALEHDTWFDELADRLFGLGIPEPIDFRVEASPAAPRVPARLVRAAPVVTDDEPAAPLARLTRLLPDDLAAGIGETAERLRRALRVVRPRVWIAAGAVGVALVAALVLVPQGGRGAAQGRAADPAGSTSAAPTAGPDAGPVAGDDPVAALVTLLDARQRCISDLSVLCLDAVGQAGSSALAEDEAVIRSLQDGAESPAPFTVDAAQVTVNERLGDSAILDLVDVADSEPASVLLMKGEAGWRIRDYLEE